MTSKHGVTGLTRTAAIDYAEYGIRVNSVNLAGTETAMVARFGAFVQEEAKTDRSAFSITAKMQSILQLNDPEHRLAKPKEQAGSFCSFCQTMFRIWLAVFMRPTGLDNLLVTQLAAARQRCGPSSRAVEECEEAA